MCLIHTPNFNFESRKGSHFFFNLRVAYVNLAYEVFECENSLTFEEESIAAFAKIRTEPYAANPWV